MIKNCISFIALICALFLTSQAEFCYAVPGLVGTVYAGTKFLGAPIGQVVGPIDYKWRTLTNGQYIENPPSGSLATAQQFSVVWNGNLVIDTAGTYRIRMNSDDQTQIWIDGVLVFNMIGPPAVNSLAINLPLTAGNHTFLAKYFQGPGVAYATLTWALCSDSPVVCGSQVVISSANLLGVVCEQNDCASNPCVHGSCSDLGNSFSCSCDAGWTGVTCDTDIDECLSSPCQNSGTCINNAGSFTCSCPPGFDGALCENNIDECDPNPCQNGQPCIDGINSFTCDCSAPFYGTLCENISTGGPISVPTALTLDPTEDCDSFTIAFSGVILADVTLNVVNPGNWPFRVQPGSLTFTTVNYLTPQTVWVCHTGVSTSSVPSGSGVVTFTDGASHTVSVNVLKNGFSMARTVIAGHRNVQAALGVGSILGTNSAGVFTFLRSGDGDFSVQYSQNSCRQPTNSLSRYCGFAAAVRYCGAYYKVEYNGNDDPIISGADNGVMSQVRYANVSGSYPAQPGDEFHIKFPDGVMFVATTRYVPNGLNTRHFDFSVFVPPHYDSDLFGIGSGRLPDGTVNLNAAAIQAAYMEGPTNLLNDPNVVISPLGGYSGNVPRCGSFVWHQLYRQFNYETTVSI